ncbi:hypothetical protein LUZ61_009184 [Rhynchospora tenuis]|uniref:Alliinase C-terminal domain-containing protein n=1 Tax=Rhynchospora tenuis TaxID=198213 RepID=A0AAD5ZX24_9POAL|nr:hypothetical protein LUZ61_009184 [Rhynchospora tenuis]
MFESFWKEVGNSATVVIPGWQKMSYFSDPKNLCCFLEPEFADEVLRLHQIVGNAVTDNRHIIVGVGSTQLIHAALFALASTEARQPVNVISAAPYYSDAEVASKMGKFIEMNTIGVSKDSQVRVAKILKVIFDGYELPDLKGGSKFFHFGPCLLANRWRRLIQPSPVPIVVLPVFQLTCRNISGICMAKM